MASDVVFKDVINPYFCQVQEERVRVSECWNGLFETTYQELHLIMEENYIGIALQRLHDKVRVKFGSSPNFNHNCYMWVPLQFLEAVDD